MQTIMFLTMAATGWFSPTVESKIEGDVSYYGKGLMQKVASNRQMSLGAYADGVALMSCGDLGRGVWLETAQGKVVGPLRVVDCAQREHYHGLLERGRVAEVSRRLWEGLGWPEDLVKATVWFKFPREWGQHKPQ